MSNLNGRLNISEDDRKKAEKISQMVKQIKLRPNSNGNKNLSTTCYRVKEILDLLNLEEHFEVYLDLKQEIVSIQIKGTDENPCIIEIYQCNKMTGDSLKRYILLQLYNQVREIHSKI